jgi:predicted transcriptional regulator of viral defense system
MDTDRQIAPLDTQLLPFVFRPKDLERHGIPRNRLYSWLRRGMIEQLERGLYRRVDAEPGENETIATVVARVPLATVCLLTALRVYDLGSTAPRRVWIALDRKARRPKLERLPVQIVWFSRAMLSHGVETREMEGVPVRITSPARTVVDCFRYRNKVGLDVALEALRGLLRQRQTTVEEIVRAAEVCRVRSVIMPYLEALLS